MRYLSVCSGIEAATVAWQPLGWQAVGFSENEKFPSQVLQHHYPETQNFGDMNDFRKWPRADIDVLVGGTPCQSFSVAGFRAGMADPRGNLALVYLAIAERLRPDWLVWENVPGVLSSDEGRDFGAIIGAMVKLGYSCAWRVLDAQYFGVPQRRRRVFVVGRLGDWRGPAKVLFEPESLRRDPPPSRETGQGIAEGAPCGALDSRHAGGFQSTQSAAAGHLIVPPITSTPYGDHDSRHEHLIPSTVGSLCADSHPGSYSGQDAYTGRLIPATADPITANEGRTYTHEGKNNFRLHNVIAAPLSAGSNPNSNAAGRRREDDENLVAIDWQNSAGGPNSEETFQTLSTQRTPAVKQGMAVRRLTPLECERLQGFPDGYTDIPSASDSARYKALGNSMAVPVMRWIGERIQSFDKAKGRA